MAVLKPLTIFLTLSMQTAFIIGKDVTVTENVPCLEGRNHTLSCEIKRRVNVVQWMNGNDAIVQYTSKRNSCNLNPDYEGQYKYSCDSTKNVFNLTILNIDKNFNGKKLVCSDGTNNGCKIINIGEYEQSLETENGTVTATSACSSRDRKVWFKWIKINAISNKETEFKPNILYKSVTYCSDECGKTTHIRYTETIPVMPGGNGPKYYLKMAVSYGTESIVSKQTPVAYSVDEKPGEFEEKRVNYVSIHFVIAAIAAAAAATTLALMFCRKRVIFYCKRYEKPEKENEEKMSFMTSAALTYHATESDLYHISLFIGSDWENLAPLLLKEYSMVTVDQIKDGHRTYQERVYNLLLAWWRRTDDQSLGHLFHLMNIAGPSVTIQWQMISKKFEVQINDSLLFDALENNGPATENLDKVTDNDALSSIHIHVKDKESSSNIQDMLTSTRRNNWSRSFRDITHLL